MLRVLIVLVVGLVEQTAAWRIEVVGERPAVGQQVLVEHSRRPQLRIDYRVNVKASGEDLIEVPARDDVVALFVLARYEVAQLICLGYLALAVVVGLKVEIHEHELLVAAVYRQIAYEQAALEVCRADRPLERTRQGNALGAVDLIIRCCEQAAVYAADRRQGIGHEAAGIVECVDALRAGEHGALVDVIGARRIDVDLLKHDEVGPHIVKHVLNAAEVFQNLLLIGGLHACAAVHEEVGVLTEPGIADVPAHDAELPVRRDERAFFG